jgi:4-diphosphocytidyl-2-C-methyl-D-erythritol kinase
MAIGLGLGADVPFFVFGKPALASGIGEKLEAYSGALPFHFVLVYPGFLVSTAEVFQNLNLGLTKCKKKIKEPFLTNFGFNSDLHLCNDLETVTASKHPVIISIKKQLLTLGAEGALMTGSGPTVFGLFSDLQTAERAKQALGENTAWDVFACDVYNGSCPEGE